MVSLDARQSHHLRRVLRRRIDDPVELVDADAQAWNATIADDDPTQCRIRVVAPLEHRTESRLVVHLGIPLMRSARLDQAVQKATELGVAEITLFTSLRTEHASLPEAKLQHLRAVAQSAAEQSRRQRCPRVDGPMALAEYLEDAAPERRLLFHPEAEPLVADRFPRRVAALSGPEGGFSDSEISDAQARGWEIVGLGPRTLRAETAPLAIATLLQVLWGDFRPEA